MSTLIDSRAQFAQRVNDLSCSDGLKRGLVAAGLTTYGSMAYSHGQPGQPIADDIFENWVATNILQTATVADFSCAKRLLFESQTLVLAALKESINVPEPTSTRRVPAAERETKLAAVKARLRGLVIEGHTEPSHGLLDACATMHQLNELRYIPPEKCTSRTHEVLNHKNPTKQLDISSETLVIKEHKDTPDMVTSSALQVQEALNRRGIALVFADLVQHEAYARYVSQLFSHLRREPPPGFSRCTVSQIIQADKAVFQLMLENNVRPKRDEHGNLALDDALGQALQSYQVSFSLMPLPSKKESNAVQPKRAPKSSNAQASQQVVRVKANFVKQHWNKGKGYGKGKSKQRVPASIHKLGGVANDPDNNPICFPYNCDGCDEAADGARCKRGLHVCAKCFGLHPISFHESKAA